MTHPDMSMSKGRAQSESMLTGSFPEVPTNADVIRGLERFAKFKGNSPRPQVMSVPGINEDDHVTDSYALLALLEGVLKAGDAAHTPESFGLMKTFHEMNVIPVSHISDYFCAFDRGLGMTCVKMGCSKLIEMSKIELTTLYEQPKARSLTTRYDTGLTPASFGALLIWLEGLGFDTHPRVFLKPLIAQLEEAKYLREDELTCLFYWRQKRKAKPNCVILNKDGKTAKTLIKHWEIRNRVQVIAHVTTGPETAINALFIG